jgi:hypothetical protein
VALEKLLEGTAVSIGETVRIELTDGTGFAIIPMVVIQGRKPELGDRIQVRIRKQSEDDTGEWTITVLGKSEHRAHKGDNPFFREDFGRPIKKD